MDEEIKEKLSNTDTWIKGLYLILFLLILGLTKIIIGALVLFQFLSSLITGSSNERLVEFGHALATYVSQIILFLCYCREEKPFPFSDWPETEAAESNKPRKRVAKKSVKKTAKEPESTENPPQ